MSRSANDCDVHFGDRFINLPWHIIGEICDLLPLEMIMETLLKAERLRPFLIERYLSQEIRLHLTEVDRGVDCLGERVTIADIIGYDKIARLFKENPDILPRKYRILPNTYLSDSSLARFVTLLRAWQSTLIQANELEFDFSFPLRSRAWIKHSNENLSSFFSSFPNLSSLSAWSCPQNDEFARVSNLTKFELLSLDSFWWPEVSLPSSLTELTIKLDSEERSDREIEFDDLYSLLWKKTLAFDWLARFPALTSLEIRECNLGCLNFSLFPPTLEILDLTYSKISRIERTGLNACWPKNLRKLGLAGNQIGDAMLKQLSDIKWPPLLEELNIRYNEYKSLVNLQNLPSSLKSLNLGNYCLETLTVSHNPDDKTFFVFPEFLERLEICLHFDSSWQIFDHDDAIPLLHKVRFPPNLKYLSLHSCGIKNLAYFVFPATLESLRLGNNRLKSLSTYDVESDGAESVGWKHLTNLRELDVSNNRLETLGKWVPPRLIRNLDLSENNLPNLSRVTTSLFDEKFREFTANLRSLDLGENGIESLNRDLYLPLNLMVLGLSRNKIAKFEFYDSLASHEGLVELDLSYNPLCRISVENTGKSYAANLKVLKLSMKEGEEKWDMSVDELYGVFEHLGLQVVESTKSAELLKVHEFK